ncbi:MAG TPA: CGNR zinc finger domain-containing protein [Bradyrhizobium sp.]|nr:CGNR zinc finger domain-containing protein [Bradyrhizobium sp.]
MYVAIVRRRGIIDVAGLLVAPELRAPSSALLCGGHCIVSRRHAVQQTASGASATWGGGWNSGEQASFFRIFSEQISQGCVGGHERGNIAAARRLTAASRDFPLTLTVAGEGTVTLAAAPGSNALGRVVAELYGLAKTDRLARLKACASEQCHWIFFDRSKPANRHWCSSYVCGNRQKTRDYRRRRTLGCT